MGSDSSFQCRHCGRAVEASAQGTKQRNHCPHCLWSAHLDDRPGDRDAHCGGAMEPIAIAVRKGGEWALIHRCQQCGALRANRIAGDDNALALTSLAVRPLAQPAFPVDRLGEVDESMGRARESMLGRAEEVERRSTRVSSKERP